MDRQRELDRQLLRAMLNVIAHVPWEALLDRSVDQMLQQQQRQQQLMEQPQDQEQPQDHAGVDPVILEADAPIYESSFVPSGSGPPPTEGPVIVEGSGPPPTECGSGPPPTECPVIVETDEPPGMSSPAQLQRWRQAQDMQAAFVRGQFLGEYLSHWRLVVGNSSNSSSGNNCAAEGRRTEGCPDSRD